MSDVSVNRLGWTGFLIPERIQSITASSSQNPIVGPATPSDSNVGTGALKTVYTTRTGVGEAEYNVLVSRSGVANGTGLAAELVLSQYNEDDEQTHYLGHIDPVVIWGFISIGDEQYSRVCRWGGYQGWSLGPVYSHALIGNDIPTHDVCAGEENQIVKVGISTSGGSYGAFIGTSIYDRTVSTSIPVDVVYQVIPLSVFNIDTDGLIRVRVGHSAGKYLLLATFLQDGQYRVHQWASGDQARSWEYIGSTEDTADDFGFSVADIEGTDDGFYVGLACEEDTLFNIRMLRTVSPYEPVWSSTYVKMSGYAWSDGVSADTPRDIETCISSDESGKIFATVYVRYPPEDIDYVVVYQSQDLGLTWLTLRSEFQSPYSGLFEVNTLTAIRPNLVDACATNGLIVWTAYSLFGSGFSRSVAAIGGWSEYAPTCPTFGTGHPTRSGRANGITTIGYWSNEWLPLGWDPVDNEWTVNTSTASHTISPTGIDITGSGSGQGRTWYRDLPTKAISNHIHRVRIVCTTETVRSGHLGPVHIKLRSASTPATTNHGLIFSINATTVSVYQETTSSATLVRTHAFDSADGSEFYIYADMDIAHATAVYYICQRKLDDYATDDGILGLQGKAFRWEYATGTTSTNPNIWSISTASRVEWGGFVDASQTTNIMEFLHIEEFDGAASAPPTGELEDVQGRQLSGNLLYMGNDIMISPLGGVFSADDFWTVANAYEYDVQHVLSADPGLIWRGPHISEQVVTARLKNAISGPIVGLLLKGMLHDGSFFVDLYDEVDGWSEYINDGVSMGVDGIRASLVGNALRPVDGVGATNTWSFRDNEFAGSWLSYGAGQNMYEIITTDGGKWDPDSLSKQPVIRCKSMEAETEDDGVVEIYPKDLLILINIGTRSISRVRVVFPATTNIWPDSIDYRELQRLLFGQVMVMGDDPDWSRSVRHSVEVETAELPSGRVRPKQKLPARRVAEVSWTDGVDTSPVMKPSRNPDWIGGDVPWADVGSTPWQIQALLERINGEAGEVVYIPRRPNFTELESSGDYEVLPRRHNFLHGRITSSVTHDAVQGEEDSTEIIRVGTITIREEV